MLERFKENIQVRHNDTNLKKKNEKRHEAIKEHFQEQTTVTKPEFINHLERSDRSKDQIQVMKENVKDIDFSNANPRNNNFMNELAFAGESIAEGFLDVFNIKVDKSIDRYKEQLQIIEERDLDKDESRFFIGGFQNGKLKQYSVKKENREELEPHIERHEERERQL